MYSLVLDLKLINTDDYIQVTYLSPTVFLKDKYKLVFEEPGETFYSTYCILEYMLRILKTLISCWIKIFSVHD